MGLTNEVYDSLLSYFSTLSYTGYMPYNKVDQLLVFTFLEELLYGPFSQFVTEEDYKVITDCLYCIYGSCMIPFPSYKNSFSPVVNRMLHEYRITDNGTLRNLDISGLRTKS